MIDCLYVCDGGTHESVTAVGDIGVAASAGLVVSFGIAEASLGELVPAEFIA